MSETIFDYNSLASYPAIKRFLKIHPCYHISSHYYSMEKNQIDDCGLTHKEISNELKNHPISNSSEIMKLQREKSSIVFSDRELLARDFIGSFILLYLKIPENRPLKENYFYILQFLSIPFHKLFDLLLYDPNIHLKDYEILNLSKLYDPRTLTINVSSSILSLMENLLRNSEDNKFIFPFDMFCDGYVTVPFIEKEFSSRNPESYIWELETEKEFNFQIRFLCNQLCTEVTIDDFRN